MKRFIFACTLLLCGIIGFVGWTNAVVKTVQPGACSTPWGCFSRFSEWLPLILFTAMFTIGLILAIKELRNDDSSNRREK